MKLKWVPNAARGPFGTLLPETFIYRIPMTEISDFVQQSQIFIVPENPKPEKHSVISCLPLLAAGRTPGNRQSLLVEWICHSLPARMAGAKRMPNPKRYWKPLFTGFAGWSFDSTVRQNIGGNGMRPSGAGHWQWDRWQQDDASAVSDLEFL